MESEEDHMRIKLQKKLQEILEERSLYKTKAEKLQSGQIPQGQPQDESIQKQIDDLKLERKKLLEMIREMENGTY